MKYEVTRRSPVTGKLNTRVFEVTPAQVSRYESGALIQHAFPDLSASDREFIISGCTDEDWTTLYGNEEDE